MHIPFLTNLSVLNKSNTPYWIEVNTNQPKCTYYFGPFDSNKEAQIYEDGYIEDLVREKALGISVKTKRCNPKFLTIYEE